MIILVYFLVGCKSIQFLCYYFKKKLSIQSSSMSGRERRGRGNSLIHAFVAFLLLSYTKLSSITMRILAIQWLFDEDGNNSLGDPRICVAGQYSLFSREYFVRYGLIATIILVFFVLLPPLFLLGLPQLVDKLLDKERFSCLRRVWPTVTIHIFLDAFQGFYKPNRRSFAGLYFVFRLMILFTYIWGSELGDYMLQQFLVTVMIVLIAVFRPYKRKVFNIIDIAIFFNLSVINLISAYACSASLDLTHLDKKLAILIYIIQYFLIWLPLIYMLSYLMYKLLVKVGVYKLITTKLQRRHGDRQYLIKNSEVVVEDDETQDMDLQSNDKASLSDSALFSRAKGTNKYSPRHTSTRSSGEKTRLLSTSDKEESLKIDSY